MCAVYSGIWYIGRKGCLERDGGRCIRDRLKYCRAGEVQWKCLAAATAFMVSRAAVRRDGNIECINIYIYICIGIL